MTVRSRPEAGVVGAAMGIDLVLILIFAALGRMSHDEGISAYGVWVTAWPFVASAAIAWLVLFLWRAPLSLIRALGLVVITVAGGMLLRLATGAGAALPFVLVASGTLLLMLLGWRLIARLILGIRRSGR